MIILLFAVFICSTFATVETSDVREKRAQTCTYRGPTAVDTNKNAAWPSTCSSDTDGAFCRATGTCGCERDADCFTSTAYPFCQNNLCNGCEFATGTNTIDTTDHYWCRDERFPSFYVASDATGPSITVRGETVAGTEGLSSFYREVCLRDGSCARCDQANEGTYGVVGVNFPTFADTVGAGTKDAIWGSIFCNHIRGFGPATATGKGGRPICASEQQWLDVGLDPKVQLDQLTTSLNVAHHGDVGPVSNGISGQVVGTARLALGTSPIADTIITQPLKNWEGSCVPCKLFDSSNTAGQPTTIPTTPTRFHSLCSRAFAAAPICDAGDNIGCRACASNAECALTSGVNCNTDGSASCTGGANCMADGSCRTCRADSDCASSTAWRGDGGLTPGQTRCDTVTGLCGTPFRCNGNFGESVSSPCPTSGLPNCNVDGGCIFCNTNVNCGATDLNNNQVCNSANGICGGCTVNNDCVGTSGANCMVGGTCTDCTQSGNLCRVGSDGGLPSSGTPGGCASTGGFCADKNDQTVCNPANRLCEDPCLSNGWCAGRSSVRTIGGGPNCQKSGFCINCGNVVANSNSCVNLDGPNTALTGFQGTPDEPDCSAAGICVQPFRCSTNPSCVGQGGGANCQVDGSCISCSVTYSTTTCSGSDGGEIVGQVNCNQASRLCVAACSTNAQCIGTQGNNCMANGVCHTCRSDSDCLTGNAWNGDGGEVSGQTLCNQQTGICTTPFRCTTNPSCVGQAGANCQKDATCISCVVNYVSSTCSNFDGGEISDQPNCNQASRLCVAACSTNAQCAGTQGNNCMANGVCHTCRSNADCISSNSPWNGDGGEVPGQSICNLASGICTSACTGNFGTATSVPCPSTARNCHDSGLCADCLSDGDCAAQDGPPGTARRNTVCDTNTRICVDPFSCGTTPATSVDNAGCRNNYPQGDRNNCNADGTCLTCTTNALCFANDGGNIPKQPRCDAASGTCMSCRSNDDCPAVAANCNEDGFCYDCRTWTGVNSNTCGNIDGPPGTPRKNQNCDTLTGICVDFCTADIHCPDSCYPKCQLERGCCVECTSNADCPVQQWRGAETSKTFCDGEMGWICTAAGSTDARVCTVDADCVGSLDGPACSYTENICVKCLYDSHCTSPTPACVTSQQVCAQCVVDGHCLPGYFCDSNNHCYPLENERGFYYGSSVVLSAGFLPVFVLSAWNLLF